MRLRWYQLLPTYAAYMLFSTRDRALISMAAFFYWMPARVEQYALNPYAKEQFGWGGEQVGLLYTIEAGAAFLACLLLRPLARRIDGKSILGMGIFIFVMSLVELGLSIDSSILLYVGMTMRGFGGLNSPKFRDLWSHQVSNCKREAERKKKKEKEEEEEKGEKKKKEKGEEEKKEKKKRKRKK